MIDSNMVKGTFLWAASLTLLGAAIGAFFSSPILGAGIGLGVFVFICLMVVVFARLAIWCVGHIFDSISGVKRH